MAKCPFTSRENIKVNRGGDAIYPAAFAVSCTKAKIKSVNLNNSRDSLTYQPSVPGSKWTYRRTVAVVGVTNYDYIRTSTDTSLYNKTFKIFNSTNGEGNQYARQDAGKYYSILTASTNKPELLVLDTARQVGQSWIGGVNGSDTYTFTMKEKIPVYQLDGFTFKNVLVVHQERTNSSGTVTLQGDTYYAQGVGQVYSVGTAAGLAVTVKLITLDLK